MAKITFFRLTLLCCALALAGCGGGSGSEPKDANLANANAGTRSGTISVTDPHASAADPSVNTDTASPDVPTVPTVPTTPTDDSSVNADAAPAVPTAVADSYSADSGMILSVPAPGLLGNDLISETVNIVRSTQPNYGSVTLNNNGSFTYQSPVDFSGTDSFTYTISDAGGNESAAQVTLLVTNGFPAPPENIPAFLDLGGTQVAKYKDNKRAAASYTFDDALISHFTIASFFDTRGLRASFYVITNNIDAPTWQYWRGLSDKGFEIGNHSMNHLDLSDSRLSATDLDREINGAQQIIEEKTGVRPLAFVFPMSLYSSRALSVAYTNHVATRLPGFPSDYREFAIGSSTITASIPNTALTDAINTGKWVVFAGHGIDGDGWGPISSQVLKSHLDFAKGQTASVWIDTFIKVARYRLCREQAMIQTDLLNPNLAVIRLQGNFSFSFCTDPLTLTIPVIKQPNGGLTARTADGQSVPIMYAGNVLMLNAYPGQEVQLSIAQASQ